MCKHTCAEKGAAAREALRSAAKDAGAGNKVGKHAPPQPVRQAHDNACVRCQMLQALCSRIYHVQRCAKLELHAPNLWAESVQIRRQRIRDASSKKAAWRDKVEALKKEEVALQPQVDRLASELPHTLKPRSGWQACQVPSVLGGTTAVYQACSDV